MYNSNRVFAGFYTFFIFSVSLHGIFFFVILASFELINTKTQPVFEVQIINLSKKVSVRATVAENTNIQTKKSNQPLLTDDKAPRVQEKPVLSSEDSKKDVDIEDVNIDKIPKIEEPTIDSEDSKKDADMEEPDSINERIEEEPAIEKLELEDTVDSQLLEDAIGLNNAESLKFYSKLLIYQNNLIQKIKKYWRPGKLFNSDTVSPVVWAYINLKGELLKTVIHTTSNSNIIDILALDAVKSAAPFDELPSNFPSEKIFLVPFVFTNENEIN